MALDDQERPEPRAPSQLLHRELTGKILGGFYSVYRELGGGFVEAVYQRALAKELTRLSLKVDCQVPITVRYKNRAVGLFRADILVNHLVLLELKARPSIEPAHECQLLNCLRATPVEPASGLEAYPFVHIGCPAG